MDQSKNHFLYDPASKDLKLFEHSAKWKVTGHEAAEYLRTHVIGSLEADVPPILDLFEQGSAAAFLDKYSDHRYKALSKQLYEIYRHGLMHNHFPNVLIEGNPQQVVEWKITLDINGHLQVKSGQMNAADTGLQLMATVISICPRQLYQDIHGALLKYAADLEAGKFLGEFCLGFKSK